MNESAMVPAIVQNKNLGIFDAIILSNRGSMYSPRVRPAMLSHPLPLRRTARSFRIEDTGKTYRRVTGQNAGWLNNGC